MNALLNVFYNVTKYKKEGRSEDNSCTFLQCKKTARVRLEGGRVIRENHWRLSFASCTASLHCLFIVSVP